MNKLDSLLIAGELKAEKILESAASKKKDGLEVVEAVALLLVGIGIVMVVKNGVLTNVKGTLTSVFSDIGSLFSSIAPTT